MAVTSRRAPLWRSVISWLFLLLFCIAAPVALLSGWARALTSDQEAYARTIRAAADDPRVQDALAEAVTLHAATALGGENPTAGEAVLQRLVAEELGEATRDVLASTQFGEVWESANRVAYALLTAELAEGWGAPVELDLSPLAAAIQAELDERELELDLPAEVTITPEDLQIELLNAGTADRIRRGLQQIALFSWGALAVAAISLLLAVALGNDRLRTLGRAGFGLAIGMVALMALLLIAEGLAARSAAEGGGAVALIAIADAVSQGLRLSAIGLALGGLLLAGIFFGLSALSGGVRR